MKTEEILYHSSQAMTKITFEFILDMLTAQDEQVYTKAEVISFIKRCQEMATENLEIIRHERYRI